MQACDRCHARKIKCDRRSPRCSVCEKAGAECFHTDRSQHRKLPRGYVQSLEDKVKQLEEQNAELQKNSVTASSPVPTTSGTSTVSNDGGAMSSRRGGSEFDGGNASQQTVADLGLPNRKSSDFSSRAFLNERTCVDSSNNIDFVKVVQSVVNGTNFRGPIPPSSVADVSSPAPPNVPKDAAIPPRDIAQPLVDAYFAHWHITFPLLHRSTFMRILDSIYLYKEYYQKNTFEAFTFDIVLAMGSVSRNRHEWSTIITESHFARAMNRFDHVLQLPGIIPLQALVLYCQYGVFSTLRDTSTNTWHLLGLAARFCTDLGLQRQHGHRFGAPLTDAPDHEKMLEIEMVRRCFWCLYNLDRVVSQTLGRPVALRDEEIDTPLPTRFDEDCSNSERWVQIPTGQAQAGTWTCPFIQTIFLRRLSGRIHQSLYMNLRLKDLDLAEKIRMREDIYNELTSWKSSLSQLELDSPNPQPTATSFLSRAWYEVIYDNAAILLYRPSPLFPYRQPPNDLLDDDMMLCKLFDSSRSAITRYSTLLQQRKLNYSWITLYAVFMAGLSYVYSVSRLSKRRKQDPSVNLPAYVDVINETRVCSNILVAICERWNDARGSCSIFDRLSSAAIQEVVSATFHQQPLEHPHHPTQLDNHPGSHTQTTSTTATFLPIQAATTAERPFIGMPSQSLGHTGIPPPPTAPPLQESFHYENDDFQSYFQELQNSIFQEGGYYESNEVMMGFDQDWFGGVFPEP